MKLAKKLRRQEKVQQNVDHRLFVGKFKLGDMVKVIARTEIPHSIKIGTVGYIGKIDQDGDCRVHVLEPTDYWQWVAVCDLELWEE